MQVINNAASIVKFRKELEKLVSDLANTLKQTDDSINKLSNSWKDGEFKKFTMQFDEDKRLIKPLALKILDFQEVTLLRKQKAIEKYCSGDCNIGNGVYMDRNEFPVDRKEIESWKKAYKDNNVDFRQKPDLEKLNAAASAKLGLAEDELRITTDDPELEKIGAAGLSYRDGKVSISPRHVQNSQICEVANTAAHEGKHQADFKIIKDKNNNSDIANSLRDNKNNVSFDKSKSYKDNAAYFDSPLEQRARQEGNAAEIACNEILDEQNEQTLNSKS